MAKPKECPKCNADISDSYQDEEFDVGIYGGWYCEACNIGYADEDEQEYD